MSEIPLLSNTDPTGARPRNVYYASQADKTHDDISRPTILCRIAHVTQKILVPPLDDPRHLILLQDESEQFGPAIRLNMRNDQDRGGWYPTPLFAIIRLRPE
jgi:hypothetical protein